MDSGGGEIVPSTKPCCLISHTGCVNNYPCFTCRENSEIVKTLFGIDLVSKVYCAESSEESSETESIYALKCHISHEVNHLHEGLKHGLKSDLEKVSPSLGRSAVYLKESRYQWLAKVLDSSVCSLFLEERIESKSYNFAGNLRFKILIVIMLSTHHLLWEDPVEVLVRINFTVFNAVKNHFQPRAWINVSQDYEVKVLLDIAKEVMGLKSEDSGKINDLKAALPDMNNGSRIIITAHSKEAALQVDIRTTSRS
ncbi:hypothetical protein GIB67_005356, partial [Kingdonia uniflora]